MKKSCSIGMLINICIPLSCSVTTLPLSKQDIAQIGNKIWHNESHSSVDKLVWWNEGENFPSLGIGHFIWLPEHHTEIFTQEFPLLLIFLRDHGVQIPSWLKSSPPCPWQSRQDFFADKKTERMKSLQTMLENTIELQTRFIIQQVQDSLPTLTKKLSRPTRKRIENNINLLAQTPQGMYALIDYQHFKGTGTNELERYKGQGWGLLQVLENMNIAHTRQSPLQQFVTSAQEMLTLRVQNSPPERNEKKWLPGWHKRVESYTSEGLKGFM